MREKEKTTVPLPSVGADGEQSLSYVTDEIIATENEEINPSAENMEEILRQMAAILSEEVTEWNGSPTELAIALELDMKPNLLTKHLNVNKARLFNDHQIDYEPVRTHAGRRIVLKRVMEQRDDA